MTTTTTSLAAFVEQRLAEDEAAARAAIGLHWHAQGGPELRTEAHDSVDATEPCWFQIARGGNDSGPHGYRRDTSRPAEIGYWARMRSFRHIARHDPARVLAQCAALRAVVELHELNGHECPFGDDSGTAAWFGDSEPCPTLHSLAAIWADHEAYDPGWAL